MILKKLSKPPPTDYILKHYLATARQAMQQHAMWGLHTGMQVYLRVCEGHQDKLKHVLHTWINAAQVHKVHSWRCVLLYATNTATLGGAAFIATCRA